MNKTEKITLVIFIISALVIILNMPVAAETNNFTVSELIQSLQQQIEKLKAQIAELTKQLEQLK